MTASSTPDDPPRRAGRPAGGAAELQRRQLLSTAAAHFARHGFEGASLRKIAAEAGLAHGLIRHYFGSKHTLWEAAADELFARMRTAMSEAIARVDPADPVARLEAQVRATVRTAARIPHIAGFVMQAGMAGGERYQWLVERHLRPAYEFVLQPLDQLQEGKRPAGINPLFAFMLANNAAIGPFAQAANARSLAGVDMSDPDTADAYADTLIAILKHGLLRQS